MKVFNTIVKILVALAAVAGAVYVVATYGEQIVAWCKKLLSGKCCGNCDCDCECECECECEAEEAAAEEPACAVEPVEEEVPAEEPAVAEEAPVIEEGEVVADDSDFEG